MYFHLLFTFLCCIRFACVYRKSNFSMFLAKCTFYFNLKVQCSKQYVVYFFITCVNGNMLMSVCIESAVWPSCMMFTRFISFQYFIESTVFFSINYDALVNYILLSFCLNVYTVYTTPWIQKDYKQQYTGFYLSIFIHVYDLFLTFQMTIFAIEDITSQFQVFH